MTTTDDYVAAVYIDVGEIKTELGAFRFEHQSLMSRLEQVQKDIQDVVTRLERIEDALSTALRRPR
jgi:hypothetical protein